MAIARTPPLLYFDVKLLTIVLILNIRLIDIENQTHHDKGSYDGHTRTSNMSMAFRRLTMNQVNNNKVARFVDLLYLSIVARGTFHYHRTIINSLIRSMKMLIYTLINTYNQIY